MDVKIILPKRASESIEMDLVYLTEVLVTNKLGESYDGFLGGQFGYGTDFENDVFFMAHCCQGFCKEDEDGNPTCQACKRECNFEHKPSGLKICWYKWIGRSQEYKPNKSNQDEWNIIFKECIESLKVVTSPKGDFSNEKEHNISYQVPTSSSPKSLSATSDNNNIKSNSEFCSQALLN